MDESTWIATTSARWSCTDPTGGSLGDSFDLPCDLYDLDQTFDSGQVFRWVRVEDGWEGVLQGSWLRVKRTPGFLRVATAGAPIERDSVERFLQTRYPLEELVASWSRDLHLAQAASSFPGLRLLRQDPWECLVSFICSSTKRIVQIKEIVRLLAERFGESVNIPASPIPWRRFPSPAALAAAGVDQLRACKLGYRAAFVSGAAKMVARGDLDLAELSRASYPEALRRMLEVPGVGPKIANCVLLFAYGHPEAFPVDVWVAKSLARLYFSRRKPAKQDLLRFVAKRFAPHPGYAQQYLFHYERLRAPRLQPSRPPSKS